MFCPSCGYEYTEEVDICPDCGEKLVSERPEIVRSVNTEQADEYDDWVEIGRLTSQQYAEMALEVLRARGIPAAVLSGAGYFGQTGQMGISSYQPAGGAFTILVPEKYIVDADAEIETILGDEWRKGRLSGDEKE